MARTYETSEDAIEGFLQTHYYKCLEDKMFNFLPKFPQISAFFLWLRREFLRIHSDKSLSDNNIKTYPTDCFP